MNRILSIVFTFFLFLNCKAEDDFNNRYKIGVNVSLQNVVNWNTSSRWVDTHHHKVGFFGIGISASEKIHSLDLSIGVSIHEETLDYFLDQSAKNTAYFTLRSTHLSIPLGVDVKITRPQERYLFARFNFIMDYAFNAVKISGIYKQEDNDFNFYRDYVEFGLGYNTMVKSNYGFRAVLSFYPIPLSQNELFEENILFSKFGISVGAYKSFK